MAAKPPDPRPIREQMFLDKICEPVQCTPNPEQRPSYPETVEDCLHLLSSYWADAFEDTESVPLDDVFVRWEKMARPLIERLLERNP